MSGVRWSGLIHHMKLPFQYILMIRLDPLESSKVREVVRPWLEVTNTETGGSQDRPT